MQLLALMGNAPPGALLAIHPKQKIDMTASGIIIIVASEHTNAARLEKNLILHGNTLLR
jgi:hypothetical protein